MMRLIKTIVFVISAHFVCQAALAGGGPTVRCVDRTDKGCSSSIQDAVDASSAGDFVEIRPRSDAPAYSEAVVIEVPDLTVYGSVPVTFEVDSFEELQTVDFDAERDLCSSVIIDACDDSGCQFGPAFDVRAPGVSIQGLTVRSFNTFLQLEGDIDGSTLEDLSLIHI